MTERPEALVPIHGVVTVGNGGTYSSLTNAGGLFLSMNSQGVDGNITALIISDISGEQGASLMPFPAPFTLRIEASGGPRTISGPGNTFFIDLNGADRVTIDGTVNGPYGLTFRNTAAGSTLQIEQDASDNTITNCRWESSGGTVIVMGAGSVTGNDNNILTGNFVTNRVGFVPGNLFMSTNTVTTARSSDNQIVGNTFTNWLQDAIRIGAQEENWTIKDNSIVQTVVSTTNNQSGITFFGAAGTNVIENNEIRGITATGNLLIQGIRILNGGNLTVARNKVYDIGHTAGASGQIFGITSEGSAVSSSNVTVVNNFVSISPVVPGNLVIAGINNRAFAGNTFTADHNSVYLSGTANGAVATYAFRRENTSQSTHVQRNNIAFNNRTGPNNNFACSLGSVGLGTFTSNGNFFAGTGTPAANFMEVGPTAVPFGTWQTGPPARDANSFAGTAASFVIGNIFVDAGAGDLHILPTAASSVDAGIAGTSVAVDIDLEPRPNGPANDIGADELGGVPTPTPTPSPTSTPTPTPTPTPTASPTPTATPSPAPSGTPSPTPTTTATPSPSPNPTPTPTPTPNPLPHRFDYDGDGKDDVSVFDPYGGYWVIYDLSVPGGGYYTQFGLATDRIVPADYDGDRKTDYAVWRPETGHWFILNSSTGTASTYQWGSDTDIPFPEDRDNDGKVDHLATFRPQPYGVFHYFDLVSGSGAFGIELGRHGDIPMSFDYNNDNLSDPVVFRSSDHSYYIYLNSSTTVRFSSLYGDRPVPADYDGDGRVDLGFYNGYSGLWTIRKSSDGTYVYENWGNADDVPVPADYDGDNKADFAVYRQKNHLWSIKSSLNGSSSFIQFGGGHTKATEGAYIKPTIPTQFDWNGDEKADIGVFRPSTGTWHVDRHSPRQWGLSSDKIVPADYDGDQRTDLAVFRPSDGYWHIYRTSDDTIVSRQWGTAEDIPVPADLDGNQRAELVVFCPSQGNWYSYNLKTDAYWNSVHWGTQGDAPMLFDYTDDGINDYAVYRASDSGWYIYDPILDEIIEIHFGQPGDIPVPGNYGGGGGKLSLALYRPSTGDWYIRYRPSPSSSSYPVDWGQFGDIPVPADYNGDGYTDIAVFRPSDGFWHIRDGPSIQFGQDGDRPIPSAFLYGSGGP